MFTKLFENITDIIRSSLLHPLTGLVRQDKMMIGFLEVNDMMLKVLNCHG